MLWARCCKTMTTMMTDGKQIVQDHGGGGFCGGVAARKDPLTALKSWKRQLGSQLAPVAASGSGDLQARLALPGTGQMETIQLASCKHGQVSLGRALAGENSSFSPGARQVVYRLPRHRIVQCQTHNSSAGCLRWTSLNYTTALSSWRQLDHLQLCTRLDLANQCFLSSWHFEWANCMRPPAPVRSASELSAESFEFCCDHLHERSRLELPPTASAIRSVNGHQRRVN